MGKKNCHRFRWGGQGPKGMRIARKKALKKKGAKTRDECTSLGTAAIATCILQKQWWDFERAGPQFRGGGQGTLPGGIGFIVKLWGLEQNPWGVEGGAPKRGDRLRIQGKQQKKIGSPTRANNCKPKSSSKNGNRGRPDDESPSKATRRGR